MYVGVPLCEIMGRQDGNRLSPFFKATSMLFLVLCVFGSKLDALIQDAIYFHLGNDMLLCLSLL